MKPEENLLPGVTEGPWCWGAVFGHFPIGCEVELQRVFSLQQKQHVVSLYHLYSRCKGYIPHCRLRWYIL